MPRKKNPFPSYLPHNQTGKARAVWSDPAGTRHFRQLPGPYDSPESHAAYAALLLEIQAAPHRAAVTEPAAVTVAELLLAYLDFADHHYRHPDGTPTSEIYGVRVVVRALRELYADIPVAGFGPLAVKAARQGWVNDGVSRAECNRRVGVVKRILKWAVAEELAPPAVYQAVAAVAGLQKGRTEAPETEPVRAVADAVVDATLPHLNRHVRGLVELQRLTGCRPGEACAVRRCDLDMSGPVWVYRPAQHKTAHRGRTREVLVGPKGQALLRQFFTADPADYLFSPAVAVREYYAARAAGRKTRRPPAQAARDAARRAAGLKRTVKAKYDRGSFGLAVDRACEKAFPLPAALGRRPRESRRAWWGRLSEEERAAVKAWRKAHTWHPNQLRHLFATTVRAGYGLEAAQVLLGHAKADVTQVYAERDAALAARVAAAIG